MSDDPKFDFGDEVEITGGEHEGRIGWIVSINLSAPSEPYTVEFSDGSDAEVKEAQLSRVTSQLSRRESADATTPPAALPAHLTLEERNRYVQWWRGFRLLENIVWIGWAGVALGYLASAT